MANNINTGLKITNAPISPGYVVVNINGVGAELGNGVTTKDCYFQLAFNQFSTVEVGNGSPVNAAGITLLNQIWTWGGPANGINGDNTIIQRSSPVSVVGNHSFTIVANGGNCTAAIKTDGTCWSWGGNASGILGDNTLSNRSSPTSVVGGHSFTFLLGPSTFLALKSDGTCWTWGTNASGALGDNSAAGSRSSPVSVVGGHSFSTATLGVNVQFLTLKSDGTCWAWGDNTSGALGDNTSITRSSPVSVVGNHVFSAINGNGGIKSNGSVWCWGSNSSGALGDKTITNRLSPTSVVGNHLFTTALYLGMGDSTCLKSDGTVWAWGSNSFGQSGDNTSSSRSSPVSVVGGHSFTSIVSNAGFNILALKSDGTCWAWGLNSVGELGDNSISSRSSPVSVVGNHSFTSVFASNQNEVCFGLKSDGSLWGWGANLGGQLGDNSLSNRSSPVSVLSSGASIRTYGKIAAGDSFYWNNTIAGFSLTTSDRVDFIYV